ncbi:hypothetical protein [Balneatrix alpica]|uniref:Uncharacterized protein n=1 Tax=Balneatrix alpica TaxID=75684 RepID=A0ABV5ZAT7_9GAMM|nr:hypothetical protein [Balneatrix alpica]
MSALHLPANTGRQLAKLLCLVVAWSLLLLSWQAKWQHSEQGWLSEIHNGLLQDRPVFQLDQDTPDPVVANHYLPSWPQAHATPIITPCCASFSRPFSPLSRAPPLA